MKNKTFHAFLWCFIILFILIFGVYSKYYESFEISTNTVIARPVIEVNKEKVKIIKCLNEDTYVYNFAVKNFTQNEISNVDFNYNIEFLLSQNDAPLEVNLYKENGEKIELKNNKTVNWQKMGLEKKEEKYYAEIKYDKNSNTLMNPNLKVQIKVEIIQTNKI